MNQAHVHLIVNHLPVITPILGALVLVSGFLLHSESIKRTAYGLFIFGALWTFPASWSGENAEELVEKIQGIEHDVLHDHEEDAELFAPISYALGILSLISLWANWKRKSFANLTGFATLILCAVVIGFAQKTARSGGNIRHTEIRNSATPSIQKEGFENNRESED